MRALALPKRWLLPAVAVIVASVISACFIELAARVAYRFGRYNPKIVTEAYLQPNPYLRQVLRPSSRTRLRNATVDVNSLGFRGREFSARKPAGMYRIFVLGGSTTFGYPESIPTTEDTYPFKLEQALRRQFGTSQIEVINAGVIGYTLRTSLVNYATRLTWYDPDMIIVDHGVNDLISTRSEDDLFSSVIRADAGPTPAEMIRNSSFLLLELNFRFYKYFRHPSFGGVVAAAPSDQPSPAALASYDRNLRHLVEMASADGVTTVIANESTWIPDACDAGAAENNARDETMLRTCFGLKWYFSHLSTKGVRRSFEAISEIQRKVARERELILVDMNRVVPTSPEYYWDFCHTRPAATTLIAEELARQMSGVIQQRLTGGSF